MGGGRSGENEHPRVRHKIKSKLANSNENAPPTDRRSTQEELDFANQKLKKQSDFYHKKAHKAFLKTAATESFKTEEAAEGSEKVSDADIPRQHIVQKFHSSAEDIIRLVAEGKLVEGIDLIDRVQDSSYRFESTTDTLGEKLSEAFSKILIRSRSNIGKKSAQKSSVIRNENADEYAKRMYNIIEDMKSEAKVKTIRATVDLLNLKGIETPNGGEWRINTIQSLQERWKNIGLIPAPKPK